MFCGKRCLCGRYVVVFNVNAKLSFKLMGANCMRIYEDNHTSI